MERVRVILSGSALRGRTTEIVSVLPGLPSSKRRITASDNSRVDCSPMDSIMSPSARCSLSAGEPGSTLTTVAYPKRFETRIPTWAAPAGRSL